MQYCGKKHKSLAKAVFKEDLPQVMSDKKWLLVDIRHPLDFLDGHLEGAINITQQEEFQNLLDSNRDKNILFNCYSGHTVSLLGNDLVGAGYENVYFLDEEITDCLEFLSQNK